MNKQTIILVLMVLTGISLTVYSLYNLLVNTNSNNMWKCSTTEGKCVQDSTGIYSTEEECEEDCMSYNCVAEKCVGVSGKTGEFSSKRECEVKCGSTEVKLPPLIDTGIFKNIRAVV